MKDMVFILLEPAFSYIGSGFGRRLRIPLNQAIIRHFSRRRRFAVERWLRAWEAARLGYNRAHPSGDQLRGKRRGVFRGCYGE